MRFWVVTRVWEGVCVLGFELLASGRERGRDLFMDELYRHEESLGRL